MAWRFGVAKCKEGDSKRSVPMKRWGILLLALAGLAALLGSCGGGEDEGGAATPGPPLVLPDIDVEIDEALVAQMEDAVAALPDPLGDNDRDQIRSMIGLPDAFTISFERSGEDGDGPLVRYETWYYYELNTAYEFADGALISNLPMDAVDGLVFLPKKYDPADFERTTTWDEIVLMLSDPDSFVPRELEAEYEAPLVFYAGEQLLVVFDDEGLFYVETVPLTAEEES
jgi:hypothetical protein